MFEVAEAYEERMGRWSRQLAPLFVEFVGVRDGEKLLDVGCGTGSLSATLARVTKAAQIVGIDASKGFIDYARTRIADPQSGRRRTRRQLCRHTDDERQREHEQSNGTPHDR